MVRDCKGQLATSTANLARTPIKFSSLILPYHSGGADASGGAILSSNNQVMTITSQGRCGYTYFANCASSGEDTWELLQGDNHPVLGEQLLPVNFLEEPDYFTGECLKLYSWGVNQTN